ncbi:MAG TPA: serine hydrolase [Firmicutes bacterium]|jgi:beta-lactamase class A|nr:serine hydrolase [Candidatus Fermentithermobacillaceae bacterium]
MAQAPKTHLGAKTCAPAHSGSCATGSIEPHASGIFEGRIDELRKILESARGEWAVVIEDLDGKGSLRLNARSPFTAASVIKIPIMMTAFHQARQGKIRLDDTIILRSEDKVGGSGVLREFHSGLALTLLDCIHMMIVVSDNTGTNLTMDAVGREEVNRYMTEKGCENSRLEAHLMRPKPEGPWNKITASDIALLLRGLADRTIENPGDCDTMIEIMKRQQYNHKMPRLLPKGVACAHKTGEVRGVTHDAGIVYGPSARFVIVCLSQKLEDVKIGDNVIGEVTKWAYDLLAGAADTD